MAWVERLVRRPAELSQLGELAAELSEDDRAVLETIDPARLEAVSRTQAQLVVARWWQPRFPAVLATLAHLDGGDLAAARRLVAHPAFERAVEEDVTGAALAGAGLARAEEGDAPPWLAELLGYEYLISTGLPRRGRGEAACAETEAALLPQALWLEGGRLQGKALCVPFQWPVGPLQDEPHDAEPDPHTLVFVLGEGEAVELEADDALADVLGLLAGGADDAAIEEALGPEDAAGALALLREVGLLG
jgi:hypothetical protein